MLALFWACQAVVGPSSAGREPTQNWQQPPQPTKLQMVGRPPARGKLYPTDTQVAPGRCSGAQLATSNLNYTPRKQII